MTLGPEPSDALAVEAGAEGLTVGAAASVVGVTVRTLHHWDAIGLVCPSGRTLSGYRLYAPADVARIHRVLIYRELGFPLEAIGAVLDDPSNDATKSLQQQRDQLVDRIARLQGMVGSVDRLIEARNAGILLSDEEQVAIFGADWQPSSVIEARERWGDTAQWAQYAERSAGRTVEDWQELAENTAALHEALATAKRAGVTPGSPEANALAERHRASISAYFDCTHSMQVCIGRTYVADPGYATYYDAIEPGLNSWLSSAIDANARSRGIDPDTATWT
ncbi:MerR family transcriptional regulator [Kribbella deserti]|uniref:MerR family transcriptional regulator n=1 Tax=Kribbella deserti TaxID=1926257 RepID=A0ABV6QVI1_9ACTN